MSLPVDSIKWLHIESTTKCNAWCPGCGRNNNGYGLVDGLELLDLSADALEKAFLSLPNVEVAQFCPTFGDPVVADNILEQLAVAKRYVKKIQLHTNGSIRNKEWWAELAVLLKDIDHDVWFTIDGLKGTHEIYRQGTFFDKIIENATAFIQAGGVATWQFIPWAHNEHQIKDCLRLSKKLKFKNFKLVKRVRPLTEPRHYRTGDLLDIQPWSENNKSNPLTFYRNKVERKNCMHLDIPSIYLNYNGKFSYCCRYNITEMFDSLDSMEDREYIILNDPPKKCVYSCGSQ